jgi:thioredoxin 1
MKQILEINPNDNLNNLIKDYSNNFKVIILDFHASWCRPCKIMSKELYSILEKNKEISLFEIDVDECEKISTYYGITSMPTLTLYRDNKIINVINGVDMNKLNNLLKININDGLVIDTDFFNKKIILQNMETIDYNNKTGICKEKKKENERYIVVLDDDKKISVKKENIKLV